MFQLHTVFSTRFVLFTVLLTLATAGRAATTLEVPDVELLYMSGMPVGPIDHARARELGPMLRKYLVQQGYILAPTLTDPAVRRGIASEYLFHHADEAAKLGQGVGADWMVLAHLVQPTSLWAELNVQLIEVRTRKLRADYDVELKGPVTDDKLTDRAAERMAQKLNAFIRKFAHANRGSLERANLPVQ